MPMSTEPNEAAERVRKALRAWREERTWSLAGNMLASEVDDLLAALASPATPVEGDGERAKLRALAEAATPGPWGWRGHDDGAIELRALHSGGPRIISTNRLTPCIVSDGDLNLFVTTDACEPCRTEAAKTHDPFIDYTGCERPFDNVDTVWLWDQHHIRPANTWAVREQPYRSDVAAVDHPDAAFIAAFNPSTALTLLDDLDRLRAENEKLRALLGLMRDWCMDGDEPDAPGGGDLIAAVAAVLAPEGTEP